MVDIYFILPSVLSILSVFGTATVLAVPAVQNPKILGSTGSTRGIEARNTTSPGVSAVLKLEIIL